jgi:hypothetical protein
MWIGIQSPEGVVLDLIDVSAGFYGDDENSWPTAGNLHLEGFVYGNISGGPKSAESRLRWLALEKEFKPQPYRQLASVLQAGGDEVGATKVLVEMQRQQSSLDRLPTRAWDFMLYVTTGYGYHPLWAFWELAALTGVGWIIYRRAFLAGAMAPTDTGAYNSYKVTGVVPQTYPRFYASVYSIEQSLQLVKLGVAERWRLDPSPNHKRKWIGRFRRVWFWTQILLGWLLATLFVGGVTGLIRKQ